MENKDKIVNLGIFAIILLIANWISDMLVNGANPNNIGKDK